MKEAKDARSKGIKDVQKKKEKEKTTGAYRVYPANAPISRRNIYL